MSAPTLLVQIPQLPLVAGFMKLSHNGFPEINIHSPQINIHSPPTLGGGRQKRFVAALKAVEMC